MHLLGPLNEICPSSHYTFYCQDDAIVYQHSILLLLQILLLFLHRQNDNYYYYSIQILDTDISTTYTSARQPHTSSSTYTHSNKDSIVTQHVVGYSAWVLWVCSLCFCFISLLSLFLTVICKATIELIFPIANLLHKLFMIFFNKFAPFTIGASAQKKCSTFTEYK